jgi:uncharacterized protein (DUF58 family)
VTTLFDPAFRSRCQYLDQVARRHWGSRFLGRKLDRRWAGGSEFVGHSDYTSGDDFRYVDWHICARHDELVTRQFRGSEDRVVYLLVDCSAAMRLGTPAKFDVARQLAGALAYVALANLDRVGIVAVSNRILAERSPLRGRRHAGPLFRYLEQLTIDDAPVSLLRCVEAFVQDRPRRGLTVVLSDLFDPAGFEAAMDLLVKRGFPPYLVQVVAPEEREPQLAGSLVLVEAGTGRRRVARVESIDRENYGRVYGEFRDSCRHYCAQRSIGLMEAVTTTPVAESVLRMIRTCTSRMYAG